MLADLLSGGRIPAVRCSHSGCVQGAKWQILWRNLKIHSEDRVKTWLSCDEHQQFLRDFLSARNFPVTVEAFAEPSEQPEANHEESQ